MMPVARWGWERGPILCRPAPITSGRLSFQRRDVLTAFENFSQGRNCQPRGTFHHNSHFIWDTECFLNYLIKIYKASKKPIWTKRGICQENCKRFIVSPLLEVHNLFSRKEHMDLYSTLLKSMTKIVLVSPICSP